MAEDLRQRYAEALRTAADYAIVGEASAPSKMLDAVMAVRDEELAKLREERDLAIAHDRQPYPTAWAYEQACKALNEWRERAEKDERTLFDSARAAGADLDGATGPSEVPEITQTVLDAVRELRADYEQAGADLADSMRDAERLTRINRRLEDRIARVRLLADQLAREPHPTHDHLCPDDLHRQLLAALDSQSPTVEAETPAGEEADDAAPRP